MVWDTGFLPGSVPGANDKPLADLPKQMNVNSDDVKFVGISHFHADRTGQLAVLKNATLLIGKGDWDGITATPPVAGANANGFAERIAEKRKVEAQMQKSLKAALIIQYDPRGHRQAAGVSGGGEVS